jgi:hypothetical protein
MHLRVFTIAPTAFAAFAMAISLSACGSTPSSYPETSDAGGPGSADDADATPSSAESGDASSDAAPSSESGPGSDASQAVIGTDGGGEAGMSYVMNVTFYGWADNSPPGNAIAYPKSDGFPTVHDVAGGTGTLTDPITLATDSSELAPGTLVYIPFIEKYLVMEDDCTECDADWANGMQRHVDVWMNSDGTENATALTACEDQWTRTAEVEVDPPAGLPVTTSPLFDPSQNTCRSTP